MEVQTLSDDICHRIDRGRHRRVSFARWCGGDGLLLPLGSRHVSNPPVADLAGAGGNLNALHRLFDVDRKFLARREVGLDSRTLDDRLEWPSRRLGRGVEHVEEHPDPRRGFWHLRRSRRSQLQPDRPHVFRSIRRARRK